MGSLSSSLLSEGILHRPDRTDRSQRCAKCFDSSVRHVEATAFNALCKLAYKAACKRGHIANEGIS